MPSIFDERQRGNLVRTLESSPLPTSASAALQDEKWQYWFFQYIWQDLAGDEAAHTLVEVYRDIATGGWELGALYRTFIDHDRGMTWDPELVSRIHEVVGDRGEGDDNDLKTELFNAAVGVLDAYYYPEFAAGVQQAAGASSGSQAPQGQSGGGDSSLPIWGFVASYMGSDYVRGGLGPVSDITSTLQSLGGPDVSGELDQLRAQCAAGTAEPPAVTLMQWGGSQVVLTGQVNRDYDEPMILLGVLGVIQPADMVSENDYRFHLLKSDGDRSAYAQCGKVVMLDPGAGDLRYALIRYCCSLRTGGDTGTITRENRRMRTDAVKVTKIAGGYENDFKAAIREFSDKSIEWVE